MKHLSCLLYNNVVTVKLGARADHIDIKAQCTLRSDKQVSVFVIEQPANLYILINYLFFF